MRAAAPADRALVALACLAGLMGVGLSAAASHLGSGASLDTAARFLLVHAAALLALPALVRLGAMRAGLGRAAGWTLLAGLVLFSGDLAVRALLLVAPVPMAAPTGGVLLMAGWAAAGLAAVLPARAA